MPARAVIGYVHGGTVRAEFCASLLGACMEGPVPVDAVIAVGSGPNISRARNEVAAGFLADQDTPWLFMCDTDMTFSRDILARLIDAADPVSRPVMGALCYSQNTDGGEPYSTMYELTEPEPGEVAFVRYKAWRENTVVRVAATGAAALLIHRDVLTAVEKHAADRAAPWFRESVIGSSLVGEDLTFCLRCGAAGIPVHVHTGIKAGHIKTTTLI